MPGIIIAFKDYIYNKGIWGSEWIGFKNFIFLVKSGALWRTTKNTILYNLLFILFDLLFQLGIAVILSEIRGKFFKKVSQTMMLMPYFISWVVAGAMVYNILGSDYGIVNAILQAQGKAKIPFMNTPSIWPFILVFFRVWKNLGYGSVVYLAAITGLDQEIYEAAEIDGANVYQRIFRITIPLVKPTVMILLMLHLSKIIKGDFQMFYNLTGNNPMLYDVSDVIDTYVYRCLIQSKNFAMSGAAGLYQSVMGFVIIVSINAVIRKIQPDYALF
jgi:putative aldouronate transport system permease protein